MPLLPVDLFRRPIFALSVATSVTTFVALGITFVTLPFYFQDVLGRSQVATGLLMTPWPATVALIAPIAGRLADRYPAGILGGIGLSMLSLGYVAVGVAAGRARDRRHPVAHDVVRARLRFLSIPKQPRHRRQRTARAQRRRRRHSIDGPAVGADGRRGAGRADLWFRPPVGRQPARPSQSFWPPGFSAAAAVASLARLSRFARAPRSAANPNSPHGRTRSRALPVPIERSVPAHAAPDRYAARPAGLRCNAVRLLGSPSRLNDRLPVGDRGILRKGSS